MFDDDGAREWQPRIIVCRLLARSTSSVIAICRSDLRLLPLAKLRFDFLLAIQQSLNASSPGLRLERIKRALDAAQRDVQRHAHLLPAFNQRPIHRTEQQMLAPPTNESLFDFREVVKVVHRKGPGIGGQGLVKALYRPPSPVTRPLPFVYQSQSFERERVVNCLY